MAVQPRRSSKTRKHKRRTHQNLTVKGMVSCPDCGEMKLSHRICRNCGSYKGETVVEKN